MTATERSLDDITTEITRLAAQALTTSTVVNDDPTEDGIYVSLRPEIVRGRIELTVYYFDDGGHAYDVTLRVDRAVPSTSKPVVDEGPLPVNGVGAMDEPPKDAA